VLAGLWPLDPSANFIGAIRIDAFLPRETYDQSLAGLAREITANPPRPGSDGVRLPGEGSAGRLARSLADGIRVSPELWQEIVDLARELGVSHP
jgi:LDH2 family malate/lactate/ureidoglycolate dehydrogenase